MNYRRHTFKALGLSILTALGLMAFTATGAQAGGGEWLILTASGNKTVKELGGLESITGTVENLPIKIRILGLNIIQKCEKVEFSNSHIVPTGHSKASVSFKDCYYTDFSLNKSESCGVKDYTLNLLMLLIKHNGAGYLLFSPLTGLSFASLLNTNIGEEECPLPHEWTFKGHFVAKLSTSPGVHAVKPLITTKEMLSLFPNDTVIYGSQVSHFEFDAVLELTGAHAGRAWGYHLV